MTNTITTCATLLIFALVYIAMIAMSFWESSVEGRNAWDKKKLGWKLKIGKWVVTTRYHFFITFVMFPALLLIPLIVNGWNKNLFGILASAYFSGMVIEDFGWFVVNPAVKLSEWNPKFANYYPWLTIGKFRIPLGYITGILIAVLFWFFFWK